MIKFKYHNEIPIDNIQEGWIKNWIKKAIELENKKAGDIYYNICDDNLILKINQDYLSHDTYTDIITFPTSTSSEIISGEIFISYTRVQENAKPALQSIFDEFCRVIIHGILHLIGYDDHTPEDIVIMRAKEDYYLTLRP